MPKGKDTVRRTCPHCGKVGRSGGIGTHMKRCGDKEDKLFWSYVNKTGPGGCWLYEGTISFEGYGYVGRLLNGVRRQEQAHRHAWVLLGGTIPEDKCLLHRCDVRNCVNPTHLYLGDRIDNARDMMERGRKHHRYTPINELLWPQLSRRVK